MSSSHHFLCSFSCFYTCFSPSKPLHFSPPHCLPSHIPLISSAFHLPPCLFPLSISTALQSFFPSRAGYEKRMYSCDVLTFALITIPSFLQIPSLDKVGQTATGITHAHKHACTKIHNPPSSLLHLNSFYHHVVYIMR